MAKVFASVADPRSGAFLTPGSGMGKNLDPDPGSGAFLTPGSGRVKKSGSESGMNNPDHFPRD
jgi:hypothetical protein